MPVAEEGLAPGAAAGLTPVVRLTPGLAAPVTRGGRPVCWVRIWPLRGDGAAPRGEATCGLAALARGLATEVLTPTGVEFLRRALW